MSSKGVELFDFFDFGPKPSSNASTQGIIPFETRQRLAPPRVDEMLYMYSMLCPQTLPRDWPPLVGTEARTGGSVGRPGRWVPCSGLVIPNLRRYDEVGVGVHDSHVMKTHASVTQ